MFLVKNNLVKLMNVFKPINNIKPTNPSKPINLIEPISISEPINFTKPINEQLKIVCLCEIPFLYSTMNIHLCHQNKRKRFRI